MKNFEVLEHTADIGGRVYGRDVIELFLNAAELLYYLAGVKYAGEGKTAKIELMSLTMEELLVKFLNELIYYMEMEKMGGKITRLSIGKKKEGLNLLCEMTGKSISAEREIKAATYHNLRIAEEEKGTFVSEIIFDI